MANHASADKRNRQRIAKTDRNRALRTRIRHSLKKARLALEGGDAGAAAQPVKEASVELARAVSQGVLHRRTASRTISRIQSQLAKLP